MARMNNLVTFAILLGLITLLIYLYYLRKRRTQQTLLWLRAQNVNAQHQFGQPTPVFPYSHHGMPRQNYYCNNGLIFMPMGFEESANQRNQDLHANGIWNVNPMTGLPHSNAPHFIAAPPYTPGNFVPPSTIEDLPPPYSSVVQNEESKDSEVTQRPTADEGKDAAPPAQPPTATQETPTPTPNPPSTTK
jgi:hypothetical protein